MTTVFTFPIPASVLEETHPYLRGWPPIEIVEQIEAAWGDRDPLPAGGLDITFSLPEWSEIGDYKQWGPVVDYIERAFRMAGVLDAGPAALNLHLREGATERLAEVSLFQVTHADGTPFVLPRKEASCAAAC
jgi:hypothetical protein